MQRTCPVTFVEHLGCRIRQQKMPALYQYCVCWYHTKSTEDVRKYAAELATTEKEALNRGMEAKSREFVEKGVEIYATCPPSTAPPPRR